MTSQQEPLPKDQVLSTQPFSTRIVWLWERSGFETRLALAKELKVSDTTVSKWMTGKAMPAGRQMMRLPELLKCSGHFLLTGDEPVEPPPKDQQQSETEARIALVRSALSLDPRPLEDLVAVGGATGLTPKERAAVEAVRKREAKAKEKKAANPKGGDARTELVEDAADVIHGVDKRGGSDDEETEGGG